MKRLEQIKRRLYSETLGEWMITGYRQDVAALVRLVEVLLAEREARRFDWAVPVIHRAADAAIREFEEGE